jgi:hypothetical protein
LLLTLAFLWAEPPDILRIGANYAAKIVGCSSTNPRVQPEPLVRAVLDAFR